MVFDGLSKKYKEISECGRMSQIIRDHRRSSYVTICHSFVITDNFSKDFSKGLRARAGGPANANARARARWRSPQSDAEGPEAMVARGLLGPQRGTNTGEATTGKVRNDGFMLGKWKRNACGKFCPRSVSKHPLDLTGLFSTFGNEILKTSECFKNACGNNL